MRCGGEVGAGSKDKDRLMHCVRRQSISQIVKDGKSARRVLPALNDDVNF